MNSSTVSRRTFLKHSMQVTAALALSGPIQSLAAIVPAPPLDLSFYHTHTGERLKVDCSPQGCCPETLARLNAFLRDFRTGDIHSIDPVLFKALYRIREISGCRGDFEIISGYRSPKTNSSLRKRSRGVAKKSLHMEGRALDIRLTGFKTRDLRKIAASLQQGGVGYYPKSDFVHIDTGRVRTW